MENLQVYACQRFLSRLKGLLFKRQIPPNQYFVFDRCRAIHTLGMRCSITVFFADRQGQLLSYKTVKPYRLYGQAKAYYAIECGEKNNINPQIAQEICKKVLKKYATNPIKI